MTMMSKRFTLVAALMLGLGVAPTVQAQSFSLGADLFNRYVWRGIDFGESVSVQPNLEFSAGILTIGAWASYSVSADGSGANENDLYASLALGPVSVGITDYYFPAPGASPFFDYGEGGAHVLELNLGAGGTDAFPLSVSANMFFYNNLDASGDEEYAMYIQFDYPFTVEEVDLGVTAAFVPQESVFYGTSTFSFINLGLSASRAIPITDSFSLPISVAYIVNPTPGASRSFLVFGVSL